MKHCLERERQLGRGRIVLQVRVGDRGSTPVLINLLMMCLKVDRSGGSLYKRLGWKLRAGHEEQYELVGAWD